MTRRALRATAAVAALAAGLGRARPGAGAEIQHRTEVREEVTAATTADTLLNPGGRVFVADSVANRLRLRSELTVDLPAAVTLKSAGAVEARHARGSRRAFEWSLPEAYLRRSLGRAELSVGRKILRWSNGYAFTPAGLLDPVRDPADPQDRLGRFEGRDLAEVDLYLGPHTLSLVYAPGRILPGSSTEQEELLVLRHQVLIRGIDLAIMAAHRPDSVDTAAASTSYVVGKGLEIHVEGALSRGSPLLLPRSALADAQHTLFGPDFYAPLRQDDGKLYVRALAGVNYTIPGGLNIVAEYFHAGDGLRSHEWGLFLEQGRFSRGLLEGGTFPPVSEGRSLPELNLLLALRGLGGTSLGRDYGLLRIAHPRPFNRADASVLALSNLRDHSFVVIPEMSLLVTRRVTAYGRATFPVGGADTEFGNVPVARAVNLGIRLAF